MKHSFQTIKSITAFEVKSKETSNTRVQLISTRIYFFLLIFILCLITIYTSIIERSLTKTFYQPTINDYENLVEKYPNEVNCPCTQIAIPYEKFIRQLQVTAYHPVCFTTTLSNGLHFGTVTDISKAINGPDFDSWKQIFIDGVQSLCELSRSIAENRILTFKTSNFYVYRMISRLLYTNMTNSTLDEFYRSVSTDFEQTMNLIRSLSKNNALISMFSANWNFKQQITPNSSVNETFSTIPVSYYNPRTNETCSCATSRTCEMPVYTFVVGGTVEYTPPGVVFSCFLLEAILKSSLSCFFSMDCLSRHRYLTRATDSIEYYMDSSYSMLLNESETRFSINDTLETLSNQLFIESWRVNHSYENFFNACAPNYCAYTHRYRFDSLEVLTTLLSVYATLSMVLRLVVPHLITFIWNCLQNRNNVQPIN